MRELTKRVQDALAESTACAEETLGSMRTIKSHHAEAEVSAKFANMLGKYLAFSYDESVIYFPFSSLTYTFLPYCASCLVLFYGGRLVQVRVSGQQVVSAPISHNVTHGSPPPIPFVDVHQFAVPRLSARPPIRTTTFRLETSCLSHSICRASSRPSTTLVRFTLGLFRCSVPSCEFGVVVPCLRPRIIVTVLMVGRGCSG